MSQTKEKASFWKDRFALEAVAYLKTVPPICAVNGANQSFYEAAKNYSAKLGVFGDHRR